MSNPVTEVTVGTITSGGDAKVPSKWGEAAFTCRVTTPHGTWMNLDDHHKYITAADSFGDTATQMRRTQIQSPYVAGSYVTNAIPDQVQQAISIYVLGDNQHDLQQNLADLIETFTQPAFQLVWSVDEAAYAWDCEAADYTVSFVNVNLFARTLSVKFQVPRHPTTLMGRLY